MLKAELHAHIRGDPQDKISHSGRMLVDRARALSYHVLAITCHDRYFDDPQLTNYAKSQGILLIPGIEATIEGKHVLIYNAARDIEEVQSFDALRAYKQRNPNILIIAPHPFYPDQSCLGRVVFDYRDLFDAWEVHSVYSALYDPNREVIERSQEIPLVGNGDIHELSTLGYTYSLIDAEPTVSRVVGAIKAGKVRVVTSPLPLMIFLRIGISAVTHKLLAKIGLRERLLRPQPEHF